MKTLVLGPEEVRVALDPTTNPKRHVFLVTPEGDILCCDLDYGWVVFRRPRGLTNRQWGGAITSAVKSLKHHSMVASAIQEDIEERTEPGGSLPEPVYVHRFV